MVQWNHIIAPMLGGEGKVLTRAIRETTHFCSQMGPKKKQNSLIVKLLSALGSMRMMRYKQMNLIMRGVIVRFHYCERRFI